MMGSKRMSIWPKVVRVVMSAWPLSAFFRYRAKTQVARDGCDRAGERELRWYHSSNTPTPPKI